MVISKKQQKIKKPMMIKSLSKIFKLAFIYLLIVGINQANAQTNPSLLFAKGIGNEYLAGNNLEVKSIKIDASGNRYVTGFFLGTADFDPSMGVADLTSAGSSDIFIAKYDASGNYVWAKGMGGTGAETGYSLALDGSNVVITGYFNGTADFDPSANTSTLTSAGSLDIFIANYDASGNYVWAKKIGGTSNDSGYSLTLDGSGNVFLTGYFASTVDFDPSSTTVNLTTAGQGDIFIAKYSSSGDYVWAKKIGGTGTDYGLNLVLDNSGNVFVTGYFASTVDFDPSSTTVNLTSAGSNDIFIAKYNSSGDYLWASKIGGTGSDYGYSLAWDGSGNVVLTGIFQGTVDFDPSANTSTLTSAGGNDIFIAKYSSSGTYVWAKGMGGTGTDQGTSLVLDGSGNVFVTGFFNETADFDPSANTSTLTSAGGNDFYIAKYNSTGDYVWAKGIGGTGSEYGNSLVLDGSSKLLVAGSIAGTVDFDPSSTATANLEGAASISNGFIASYTTAEGSYNSALLLGRYAAATDCSFKSIVKDGSGNLYVTGYFAGTVDFDPGSSTANLTSAGGNDIFLAKYDASGNYVWARGMGGTGADQGNFLALDLSGNLVVTGSFNVTADFDPGSGTSNLTSAGSYDIFIAKYNSSGDFVWAKGMGGTDADVGNSFAIDGSGNVVLTGYFNSTSDFDPGSGTSNLTSAGSSDIFIAKYNSSGDYVWAKAMGGTSADVGNSLALDVSGNLVVTGYFQVTADFDPGSGTSNLTSAGSSDIFIAKYNSSGDYVWAKGMGGTGNDQGYFLALDGSGNLVVTGYFNGTADFDPGSGTFNLTSAGGNDFYIAKYNSTGDYLWAKAMGGTGSDVGNSLALDGNSNVVVTGYFNGTNIDFDPSANTSTLTSAGGSDIFIAKYNSSGDYVWAIGMGGTGADQGNCLTLDGSSKLFVAGHFKATVDFDPNAGTTNLTSMSGGQYGFVAAYVTCINPTSGGTIAAAQSGTNTFNPVAFTSSVAASGETGTLEYKWQSSTTSSSTGFADIASSDAATYDAGALTQTTWFKRLARVTCSSDWTGAAASNVLEVTVIAALPVNLISFTAKPTPDNKVSLAWVTSAEQVNKGFRIERQTGSMAGKYDQIGFVGSKAKYGNSQRSLTYSFIDVAPIVGAASFYRLVQEDLDGKLTYSEVRMVKLNGQSVTMVFPNPSNGVVNIYRTLDGKKMNIQVTDQSGKIIINVKNITDVNYKINLLHSGVYNIKMIYPETGEESTQRIVVQK